MTNGPELVTPFCLTWMVGRSVEVEMNALRWVVDKRRDTDLN